MSSWDDIVGSILEPVLSLDPRIGEGIEGCSAEDIAAIERKFGLTLPPAFVALIARIGRNRAHLFKGADFGYPGFLHFRGSAERALAETETGLSLDPRDFVFDMDQGYQFLFFRADAGEDPEVFLCDPDDPRFVAVSRSFTAWLKLCMDEELELWKGALAAEARGHSIKACFGWQPVIVPRPWWKFW